MTSTRTTTTTSTTTSTSTASIDDAKVCETFFWTPKIDFLFANNMTVASFRIENILSILFFRFLIHRICSSCNIQILVAILCFYLILHCCSIVIRFDFSAIVNQILQFGFQYLGIFIRKKFFSENHVMSLFNFADLAFSSSYTYGSLKLLLSIRVLIFPTYLKQLIFPYKIFFLLPTRIFF